MYRYVFPLLETAPLLHRYSPSGLCNTFSLETVLHMAIVDEFLMNSYMGIVYVIVLC